MRRKIWLPALLTALMLSVLIALGVWQLQRHQWKQGVLEDLRTAQGLPEIDLGRSPHTEANFRPARVGCVAHAARPQAVAGRSWQGDPGYSYRLPCGPNLWIDIGWARRPDAVQTISLAKTFRGVAVERAEPGTYVLIAREPMAPLVASAPPTLESIPDNHLMYAGQWFSFAAILIVIFGLYVRWAGRPASSVESDAVSD
jgi:surfeit locus 1 family protein